MALQIITNINVDFYDKRYILINAKQYDDCSRWISIACYNHGSIMSLNAEEHSVYVRYKKADGYAVLNSCRINNNGEVLVQLTEQMLAADGICYVDLVVVNRGGAMVDTENGEIIAVDDAPILSTMAFCINVHEASVDNSEIESSQEFNALNDLIQRAEADYSEVIQMAKSYAIGNAGGIRYGEDTNNAKYYYEQSLIVSDDVKISEANALNSSNVSKSYAIGGTGIRENEDFDNSRYYYELSKAVADGLNSGFIPMGTISFAELETAEKANGFTYNINEDFVTDERFAEGAGMKYNAGTNVYCRSDGLWDCFGGHASPIATVDEVKSYLGI